MGEEFALVLFDLGPQFVADVADRVRRGIEDLGLPHGHSQAHTMITLSVGVAIAQPTVGRTPQGAVQLADEALYEAEASGRNQVVMKKEGDYAFVQTGVFISLKVE